MKGLVALQRDNIDFCIFVRRVCYRVLRLLHLKSTNEVWVLI